MEDVTFRSVDDVRHYLERMSAKRPEDDFWVRAWRRVEDVTLLLLLAMALGQYYYFEVMLQVLDLPRLIVNIPIKVF